MKNLIKTLNIVGYIWVVLAGFYIFSRYWIVLTTDGIPFVKKVLSFINLWNVFFALITLMPGLICILLSEHFRKKKKIIKE